MTRRSAQAPIGVFDSGAGGLTVYKALRTALPHENFVYLGDTARLPYGTKSAATVSAYALQAARLLLTTEKIKLLVVACNTASALALADLRQALPDLPSFGVIEPGARAALAATPRGAIAVLATESTVRSGAYADALHALRPEADVKMLAANLLVSLVEEGWWDGSEAEAVTRRYLDQLGTPMVDYGSIVLGCTHFPLLAPLIRHITNGAVPIIDSAHAAAEVVAGFLRSSPLAAPVGPPGASRFLVTDSAERFSRLGRRFAGNVPFTSGETVFHVDLAGTAP